MRKFLLPLLIATTMATPAFAQQQSREDRAAAREERKAERAEAREKRSEARQERQDARPQRVQAPQRAERSERGQRVQAPQRDIARDRNVQGPAARISRQAVQQRQVQRDANRERLRQERADSRDRWIDNAEQTRRRVSVPITARPDRPAPPPVVADSHRPAPTWHTDWRRDHRYDWRSHRHRHRSLFHLGLYFDPFGWGYQRWGIGWRLWPSYYSSNYWLNDPWMYRLPYAPWPYKWVRYYDDALLVNTYTGQVVDVIYDFFW